MPYMTLHCIALHCITLHYIALRFVTLHGITLHFMTLHTHTYTHTFAFWDSTDSEATAMERDGVQGSRDNCYNMTTRQKQKGGVVPRS